MSMSLMNFYQQLFVGGFKFSSILILYPIQFKLYIYYVRTIYSFLLANQIYDKYYSEIPTILGLRLPCYGTLMFV